MATIKTNEGQDLIVENNSRDGSLWVTGRLETDKRTFSKEFEVKAYELYASTALADRPRSKGDLTADTLEELANLLDGYAVAEGLAETRSGVTIERFSVEEREESKQARKALVPSHEEDWPEEGSSSDQVRFLLDEYPTHSDEEIAVIAGCSRSLVSDIKKRRDED